jgi:small subunit ribosomal protein S4
VEKRNFPPGQHGQSKKVKKVVGYGLQLREKQKAKRIYFTLETQFRAYYEKASNKTGVTGELLLQQLETRLDNVCYRLGFAMSRRQARQLVRHGHISVNGRKVNIPSFQCKVGDVIEAREGSKKLNVLEESANFASGQRQPAWLEINRDNRSGKVLSLPNRADVNLPVNEQLIVELYSK